LLDNIILHCDQSISSLNIEFWNQKKERTSIIWLLFISLYILWDGYYLDTYVSTATYG
jgi:hypothetical protein